MTQTIPCHNRTAKDMRDPQEKVSSEVSNSFTNVVYENCTHKNWVEAGWEGEKHNRFYRLRKLFIYSPVTNCSVTFLGNIIICSSFKVFQVLSVTENYHFSFPF